MIKGVNTEDLKEELTNTPEIFPTNPKQDDKKEVNK